MVSFAKAAFVASTSAVRHRSNSKPSESTESEGAKLTPFQRELIAVFVEMMQTMGLPKSYGEIYGLLYATPTPLGFAEIHDRLELSKGSVSGGLKALREIGAIRVTRSAEDRRERYEPELELRKLILAYMQERIHPQLDSNVTRMQQLEHLLESSFPEGEPRRIMNARMGKLAKWRKKAAGLIPWIAKFLR